VLKRPFKPTDGVQWRGASISKARSGHAVQREPRFLCNDASASCVDLYSWVL